VVNTFIHFRASNSLVSRSSALRRAATAPVEDQTSDAEQSGTCSRAAGRAATAPAEDQTSGAERGGTCGGPDAEVGPEMDKVRTMTTKKSEDKEADDSAESGVR
ncbi:unnamed protein product, partial [Polarella glacialis]